MKNINVRKLVMCALMMAICFVVTRLVSVPMFYTKGYVNLGDLVVLVSGYVLGGWYGAGAAAFGSAIADASFGFYTYVPATFVIKGLMALVSDFVISKAYKTKKATTVFLYIFLACFVSELVMIGGYFIYECWLYGSVIVALSSVIGNVVQGITCLVPSVMIIFIFKKNSAFSKMISSVRE